MADVIFIAIVVAFFGLCVLYIKGCERILRSGDEGSEPATGTTDTLGEAA
jgi:hypothetical protein